MFSVCEFYRKSLLLQIGTWTKSCLRTCLIGTHDTTSSHIYWNKTFNINSNIENSHRLWFKDLILNNVKYILHTSLIFTPIQRNCFGLNMYYFPILVCSFNFVRAWFVGNYSNILQKSIRIFFQRIPLKLVIGAFLNLQLGESFFCFVTLRWKIAIKVLFLCF